MKARQFRTAVKQAAWLGLLGVATLARAAVADEDTGILRGLIIDADTGSPTPCSVAIMDAAGRVQRESASFQDGFRCDGHFTKRLTAGTARVRVWRGFETRAVERVVSVPARGETEIKVRLERAVDLRRRGWYAGDSHAHMIHGEKTIPVDFDFVALTARAEDLQYLSLAHAWAMDQPTPEKVEAALRALSRPDCVLTWNIEAPKNYLRGDAGKCLGHCWTLGMGGRTAAGADVIELLLAASAHDYESEKPSFANFESHQLIHAQSGATFYTHPARWWSGAWGGQGGYPKQEQMRISNMAVELPLDTILGPTFDGMDVLTGAGEWQANAMAFDLWCLLLNHGYRVAATASSDACFDRAGGAIPGSARTYTFLEGEFSLPAVARATVQGRTFVTSGPLLLASVDGQQPGSTFRADGRTRPLQVEAWASGVDSTGLTRVEIWRNGRPMQTNLYSPPVPNLNVLLSITERDSAWYCVRLFGGDPRRQRAISGAFFFDPQPHQPPPPATARVQVTLIDHASGERLSGSVREVAFHGPLPIEGASHLVAGEGTTVTVPGVARLRAEAPGFQPVTLSPFLDHPPLVNFITGLAAEDLLRWETFERARQLLGEVKLTFRLKRQRAGTP
jgi:hypothetical protein